MIIPVPKLMQMNNGKKWRPFLTFVTQINNTPISVVLLSLSVIPIQHWRVVLVSRK